MWLMLQQDQPDDYVIATGESHSVRELVEIAFGHVGLDWEKYVTVDPRVPSSGRSGSLIGDASKARTVLGWQPEVDFPGLVRMMVDATSRGWRARPARRRASKRADPFSWHLHVGAAPPVAPCLDGVGSDLVLIRPDHSVI